MSDRPPSFAPANPTPRPDEHEAEASLKDADLDDRDAEEGIEGAEEGIEEVSERPASYTPIQREGGHSDASPKATTDKRVERAQVSGAVVIKRPIGRRAQERVTDGLAERLAERQRARRRLRVRALIAASVALVILIGGGYLALLSPVLALRATDVSVAGVNDLITADRVLVLVQPHEGKPLLRIDTPALRDQLEALTGVQEASVQRDFPNGLAITITPRVPVATVAQDGVYVLLDGDGVELARTDAPREGVPQVEVPVGAAETAEALTAVLSVMAALPSEIRAQVSTAAARSAFEVDFTLVSGAEVIWGSAEDNALKVAVLQQLLPLEASVYDVSAPESPITR